MKTRVQVNMAIPPKLKQKLQEAAAENERSVSGEAVARLERSFDGDALRRAIEKMQDTIEGWKSSPQKVNISLVGKTFTSEQVTDLMKQINGFVNDGLRFPS